jgi:hypothetical protein
LAASEAAKSASFLAASRFLVPFMMAVASMSQPMPSAGRMTSSGAPLFFSMTAR